jgi:predicted CopG family antitoxin
MGSLTIHLDDEIQRALEREADEEGMSLSEYVHQLVEKGREYDEVERKLEHELDRRAELQLQLKKLSDSKTQSG